MEFHRDDRVERRRARRRQIRRRRIGAAIVALAIVGIVGVSATNLLGPSKRSTADAQQQSQEETGPTYRDGHRTLLPTFRIVATFGAPYGGSKLGDLGVGTPTQAADRLVNQVVHAYDIGDKPVMPALELISTMSHPTPTESGLYSSRYSTQVIDEYLSAARQNGAILILDIQPGHARWMDEVQALRKYLEMPDVSLALDPEWSVPKDKRPGQVIGTITPEEINEVSGYLQQIVEEHNLPQKLLIVHQFKDYQLKDRSTVVDRPDVAIAFNVDGFGTPEAKKATYSSITSPERGKVFPYGFKLFYEEDVEAGGRVMEPGEVMGLDPAPDIVVYE